MELLQGKRTNLSYSSTSLPVAVSKGQMENGEKTDQIKASKANIQSIAKIQEQ